MMRYIFSSNTNPYWNLALEQYVFDELDKTDNYFMLWQNNNSIIVGKHQNTLAEINQVFVKNNGISVARRLSGGGAVYHDLGNLNYTFITDSDANESIDFSRFCFPVQRALASLGVKAEISGRNDMTIDGKKFSGNSQYVKDGRVMHHGTLMYNSNLAILTQALNVSQNKIESKGIKSVRSRVTNICEHVNEDVKMEGFIKTLEKHMFDEFSMERYDLLTHEIEAVTALSNKYDRWEWNFGNSPAYTIYKEKRIDSCGLIQAYIDVDDNGRLNNIVFTGDYFFKDDPKLLSKVLCGHQFEYNELSMVLSHVGIGSYFNNASPDQILDLLFF